MPSSKIRRNDSRRLAAAPRVPVGSNPAVTVAFNWTAEGRLGGYTVGSTTVALQYDAGGRLVREDVNGSPARYFLWEGAHLLAELGPAATTKVAEYSYYGLDRPHAVVVGDTALYAHVDGLGNVVTLTDSTQALRATYGGLMANKRPTFPLPPPHAAR